MAAMTEGDISAAEIPRKAALSTRAAPVAAVDPTAGATRFGDAGIGWLLAPVTFMASSSMRLTAFHVGTVKGF